jgi:hypothetical protein
LIKEIHLIVFLADLIRKAARPRLDFVEFVLFLIIARFANINVFIVWKSAGATLIMPCEKHNETPIDYFVNMMVSILACLNNLVLVEMSFKSMHCLLRPIIPASINPLLAVRILPSTVNLSDNRLCNIIGILNVDPVA